MYDKLFSTAQFDMKPVIALAEVNANIADKMIKLQSSYVCNMLDASVAHMKAVTEMSDANKVIEAQQAFVKDSNQKLLDVSQENIALLTAARDEASKLFNIPSSVAPAATAKKAASKKAA